MKIELSGHYYYKRIVKSMLPMVVMMVVISLYSVVDGLFVSNYAGSTAFASLNIVWPPIAILSAIGLLLGSGGSALVSKTFGEGDDLKANQIFTMLINLSVAIGIIIAIVCYIFMPKIVVALGSDGEMIPLAIKYGRIVILAMPGYILQVGFQPFFMTAEKPQLGTIVSILCGCVNIGLDYVLIVLFDMGLEGAAWATGIALMVGGFLPLFFFTSKWNKTHLQFLKFHKIDWKSIWKSCSNGLSEFVGTIAFNVVGIAYNLQLMKYIGENGVSAYGIIMYVGFIFGAIFIGYNTGMTQVIAYHYGADDKKELRSLLHKSLILIGLGGVVITLFAELASPILAKIFVGYDQELLDLTVHAMRIYMMSFLICGFNMFCSAWFTALNNGVISAIAAFARTLVFELGCIIILPKVIGINGIWLSVNVAEVLALILAISLILGFRKRYGY